MIPNLWLVRLHQNHYTHHHPVPLQCSETGQEVPLLQCSESVQEVLALPAFVRGPDAAYLRRLPQTRDGGEANDD